MISLMRLLGGRKRLLASILVVSALLAALGGLFSLEERQVSEQWVSVQPQVLETSLGLLGRLDAGAKRTISAPFEGVMQDVSISEGQRVMRDQMLLRLDTKLLDIQVREALSELLKSQSAKVEIQQWSRGEEVARARRSVSNVTLGLNDSMAKLAETARLFEKGIVARMEIDTLEQQIRVQRLDLAASEAELRAVVDKGNDESLQIADMALKNAQSRYEALQELHSQRVLRAPFDGIVLRPRSLDGNAESPMPQEGGRTAQGLALLEIASLERVKAIARVEEADLHLLSEGMPVAVSGDAFPELALAGEIESISVQGSRSDVSAGGSTFDVIVSIEQLPPEQQQKLRLGMSVQLLIVTYRADAGIAIPEVALDHGDDGRTYVIYRKSLQEKQSRVAVSIGRAVKQGVEVFGLEPGYVLLPTRGP